MLIQPFLAKCGDRTSLAKTHPLAGNPEQWLHDKLLSSHELSSVSFDFFVNWSSSPRLVSPAVWIKRILKPEFSFENLIADLSKVLLDEFGKKRLKSLYAFSTNHLLDVSFIIYHDHIAWQNEDSQLLIVSFAEIKHEKFVFKYEMIDLDELMKRIKQHSGGHVKMGRKGLTYSTSNLECFLSGTDALYPGDADMILLDRNEQPVCILEFKKHTMSDSISMQKLSNYYPYPDGRKYDRLAMLAHHISKHPHTVPLLILYHPTNPGSDTARLELLSGKAGDLRSVAASDFALPNETSDGCYQIILRKILRAVAFHHTLK